MIADRFKCQPLLVDRASFPALARFESRIAQNINLAEVDLATVKMAASEVQTTRYGDTVILRLSGLIELKPSVWMHWFGGTSCESFSREFQEAMDDSEVKQIVIDVDSPGGISCGVPELASQIFSQREKKPTCAVANPSCASAATWIATACSEVVCLASGYIGSIGSYMMHVEYSKAYEEAGINVDIIRDPVGKADFNPFEEMRVETREHYQGEINELSREFVSAVAKHRGVAANHVNEQFGQGRMMNAKAASVAGLIDRIGSIQDVVLGSTKKSTAARTHLSDLLRARRLSKIGVTHG